MFSKKNLSIIAIILMLFSIMMYVMTIDESDSTGPIEIIEGSENTLE